MNDDNLPPFESRYVRNNWGPEIVAAIVFLFVVSLAAAAVIGGIVQRDDEANNYAYTVIAAALDADPTNVQPWVNQAMEDGMISRGEYQEFRIQFSVDGKQHLEQVIEELNK